MVRIFPQALKKKYCDPFTGKLVAQYQNMYTLASFPGAWE